MNKGNNIITSEQVESFYDRLNVIITLFLNSVIKYYTISSGLADYVLYQSNFPELIKIGGDRFKDIVVQMYWSKYKKNFEFKYLQFIIDNIKHNYTGEKEHKEVHNRIYHDKQKNEIVYLLREDNTAVKIDSTGFQVFNNTEIIFADEVGMLPQALPRRGVTMEEFHRALDSMISVNDPKKRWMIKIYIIACFLDIMTPHLYLLGASGSSKTYLAKTIRKIVCPNRILLNSSFAKDELNRILFNATPIIVLNNINEVNSQLNDLMANVYDSGAGTIMKKLYSPVNEKVIIAHDSKVILTSTKLVFDTYELIDRTLLIKMEKLNEKQDEDVLNKSFASKIEIILGGLFTVLSKVLEIASTSDCESFKTSERIASFEYWGSIIAESMQIPKANFQRILRGIRFDGVATFCDNFQEIMLITKYLETNKELSGTAEQIMSILKDMDDAEVETMVSNPATFSRKLNEYAEVLEKLEIKVEKKARGKSRNLTITKIGPNLDDNAVANVPNPLLLSNNKKNKENSDVATIDAVLHQNTKDENAKIEGGKE